jgi:hypothetical protein
MSHAMIDFSEKPCVFCGKVTARYREINPPDDSTRIFKWVCGTTCLAMWSTGQPKPEKANARLPT